MNFKKITIALAILLTIFAVNAKAQVVLCPEGATYDYKIITLPNCPLCTVKVDLCWKCVPSGPGGSGSIEFAILKVEYLTSGCNDCGDIWEQIIDVITSYPYIKAELCTSYPNIPPCGSGTLPGATLQYPLCFTKVTTSGVRSLVACPDSCLCIAQYEYCYQNGEIITTVVSKGVVAMDGYTGPCPPLGDCSLYNRWSFDWPLLNGSTPCFNMCDDTP